MTDVSIINRVTAVQITYSGGTVELQAPPIRRAPSTTDAEAAVAMTRAQAVARLADGWVPPAFFVAGGRLYAYRGPGVTAISDMPGCVPFGAIIFPDQFGLPTTGDDILRIEEMAAYAASVAASTGGCVIEAWGCKSKISRTFAPQNWTGVVFRGYQFEVHSAWSYTPGATIWGNPLAFPDWNAFTARCLMYLGPGSGQPTIEYCSFNGIRNGVCRANGILHSNGSSIIRYNSIIRVPDFGYWNTNGNDQEVYANRIIQWDQSSPENQDASKCTAVPVVIASGDCTVRDNLIGYGKFSAVFHGTAGRFEGNHLVCGMPDNATGTAAQAPRYNVWITSSGGPELSNNQYDKGGILSDCSAWASQGDKFHLDCKYNNVLLPMVCFRPIGANDKIRGLVLTGAACIGKKVVLGVTKDRESGDWFTVDETYGTLATDTDNPNTIIADNVYKSGESATQPIPSTRGARIFVYRSDAWTQDPVTGLWSTAAFDFSAPMFLPTRFPWHPADMTANIKSLAGSPTYGRMVARKVLVGRYYLEARWNAPPDVTHLLVKWDYTNLRREIIGEAPNDADSHEIELFCAPEPVTIATRAEAVTRVAAGEYAGMADGAICQFGRETYRRLASATSVPGLAGFVPGDLPPTPYHFGAVGDGVTADKPAFDAAIAYGGTIRVPRGVYKLSADVSGDFVFEPGVIFNSTGKAVVSARQINRAGAEVSHLRPLNIREYVFGNVTATQDGLSALNSIYVTGDTQTAGHGQPIAGFQVVHAVSNGASGSRFAMHSRVAVTGAVTDAPRNDITSMYASGYSTANQGGTGAGDIDTAYNGGLWGVNPNVWLASGATHYRGLHGMEVNASIMAGASAFARSGVFVAKLATDANRADEDDAGILFGGDTGAVTWGHGIQFGASWGQWPFASDSTLIGARAVQYPTPVATIDAGIGIDFEDVTFATAAIRTPGFEVGPSGDVTAGAATLTALTVSGAVGVTDGNLSIKDGADATKVLRFEASGITTGTTRTLTAPDESGRLALASHVDIPCLVPPSGEYVWTTIGATGATGTAAGVADRMDIFPFTPRADLAIDQLVVKVSTLAASATGKIIVYASDANGRPDAKLLESADLDFSTTGNKAAAWVTTLRRGHTYWLGVRHSSTATLNTWETRSTPDINGGSLSAALRKIMRRSLTYATAAPASWGYSGAEINAAAAPAIWLRMA